MGDLKNASCDRNNTKKKERSKKLNKEKEGKGKKTSETRLFAKHSLTTPENITKNADTEPGNLIADLREQIASLQANFSCDGNNTAPSRQPRRLSTIMV